MISENASPTTRHKILVLLRKHDSMTAAELGRALNLTSMGVRRHLNTLLRDGLVGYRRVQRGLGRPSFVYSLTTLADDLFPKNYPALTNELLRYLELLDGDEKVEQLFQRRGERRLRQAQARLAGKDLAAQVAELARILDEDGYLAEWEQLDADTWFVREFNCAVRMVAEQYQEACGSEIEFIQAALPEAEVTREHHIMAGDGHCGYRIRRRQG
ncbi:MAG: transcriptional regulator [Anaerolineae bacterium]|nr:transcriptional regulator [Anaerolineae bacterium]